MQKVTSGLWFPAEESSWDPCHCHKVAYPISPRNPVGRLSQSTSWNPSHRLNTHVPDEATDCSKPRPWCDSAGEDHGQAPAAFIRCPHRDCSIAQGNEAHSGLESWGTENKSPGYFHFSPPYHANQAAQPPFSGQGAALDSFRPQKEKGWWFFPAGSVSVQGNTEAALSWAVCESDPRPLLCTVKVKREALLPSNSGFLSPSYFGRPSILAQYFLIFNFPSLLLPCLSGAFLSSSPSSSSNPGA